MKQNKMRVIGITGGVGAGKSTVLEYLEKFTGAYVIQADQVGHKLMEPGQVCYKPMIAMFGKEIVKEDKSIDRRAVSDIVFKNEAMLQKLNALIHPAVKSWILEQVENERKNGRSLFFVEAALLLEDHYDAFCDEIWYIHADREIRIERLMRSRGYSREKAENIIQNQASEEFFRAHADCVIENNGAVEETSQQIQKEAARNEAL